MSESQSAHTQSSKKAKRVVGKSDAVRYHCNYCGKDISNVIRIKCAVCQDFDLCIQCFSVGVEIGGHKSNHDYHDALNFPLFEPEWGADEELLILEGIEMYGMGNWSDISDHVGTKTAPQCKEHYFKIYVDTPTAPLPDMSRILTTTESLQQRNKSQSLENDSEFWDDLEDNDNKKETVKKEEPPITQGGTALGYSFPELAGYMPLRGDFETEYENDAETVLCDIEFTDADPKEEIDNKLKLIEAYNKKLDERIKRKRFIIDNGLLEYKKKDKKRSKEEKEVYDKMRQFLRLMNKEEHSQLTNAILVEKQIRKRIEELKKYRRLGLHTLQESQDYEEEKRKKDFNEMVRKRETGVIPTTRNSSRWLPTKDKSEKLQEKHTKPKIRKPGSPLDISGAPGYDLLSEKERDLCATIRIFPQQYTLIKDTLIRESIRQGYLKKAVARQLIKIDVNKTSRIFDFFESCGWINKTPRTSTPPLPPVGVLPNGNSMLLNSNSIQ